MGIDLNYILTCTKSISDILSDDESRCLDEFKFLIPVKSVLKRTIKNIKSGDRFLLYSGKSSSSFAHRGVFFSIYEATNDIYIINKDFILELKLISEIEPRITMKQLVEISSCEGISLFSRCNGQRVITKIEQIPV